MNSFSNEELDCHFLDEGFTAKDILDQKINEVSATVSTQQVLAGGAALRVFGGGVVSGRLRGGGSRGNVHVLLGRLECDWL